MDNLFIEEEKGKLYSSPKIDFKARSGKCLISGKSTPKNTNIFYKPVLEWVENYFKSAYGSTMQLKLKLSKYDDASSEAIYNLMFLLRNGVDAGGDVEIVWQIPENNSETENYVTDIMAETGLDIEIIYK